MGGTNMIMKVQELISRGKAHNAVLAGGFGSRLDALTDIKRNKWAVAKPAAPLGSGALIDASMRSLVNIGNYKLNVLTCYLPETIRHVIGNGKRYHQKADIREHAESPADPLDTAGAVGKLVESKGWYKNSGDVVIVPSADVIHNMDLNEVLDAHLFNRAKHGAVATIVVNAVPWDTVSRFGTVSFKGMPMRQDFKEESKYEDAVQKWLKESKSKSFRVEEFREKKPRTLNKKLSQEKRYEEVALSNLNNSSIYVFESSFFASLLQILTKRDNGKPLAPDLYRAGGPTPFSDWGKHVFNWLTQDAMGKKFPVFAYIHSGYWRDAGTGEDLRAANMDVLSGQVGLGLEGLEQFTDSNGKASWKGKNVFIHKTAHISNSIIGDNVIIGANVKIVHSVVGRDAEFKEGAQMWDSVVSPKHRDNEDPTVIGTGAEISDCLVLGGQIGAASVFRRKEIYDPYGGVAVGSMMGKTEYNNL